MTQTDSTTRDVVESAASALTLSRSNGTRQGACPFLNSHRDGECAKCVEMHAHDAGLANAASLSPRQRRAIDLTESGAVAIVPGQAYAIVQGSGRATYRVSRDGCECPDYRKRGLEQGNPEFMCKHRAAARALCTAIRLLREEARQTGRVRLPANVARALANGAAYQAAA